MRPLVSCFVWAPQWTDIMYRTIIPSILLIAAAAAPQNSEITYVKIQPVTSEDLPPKTLARESRIENLPLTIPGTANSRSFGQVKSINKGETRDKVSPQLVSDDTQLPTEDDPINGNPLLLETSNESQDNQRKPRSEETTEVYENETTPTEVTDIADDSGHTELYETKTKAPTPRFLSKLSYFQKDDELKSSIATNLVERTSKRRFKSKCRCEKIWNCPKLQISVPRCPNEYFMCCF